MSTDLRKTTTSAFLGLAIGDAMGVPVEGYSRIALTDDPVTDYRAFGTHNQPIGTWSDDSSMSFCTAESLCNGYNLYNIAEYFGLWFYEDLWTARGQIFDYGIVTEVALNNLKNGVDPHLSGEIIEGSNGNGSLVRLLPLAFYLKEADQNTRFNMVMEVSGITHRHMCTIFACFILNEYTILLLEGDDKWQAYAKLQVVIKQFIANHPLIQSEICKFSRILDHSLAKLSEDEISSSGYVIDTLEAALWCFLTTDSFEQAVLKAVNLGNDTDATGCVCGGLAGLYYGLTGIPQQWIVDLAKNDDIIDLAERFADSLIKNTAKFNTLSMEI